MEQSDEIKTLQNIFEVDISPYVTIREFEPDEFLIREGERPDYLYYLMEGRAKLFLSQENGKISLLQDDLDTILATDNRGLQKKPYFFRTFTGI